jgi:hypothetical protein
LTDPHEKPELASWFRHAAGLDMSRGLHTATLKQVSLCLAAGYFTLAVLDPAGLLEWSLKLPVGPVGDAIIWTAGQWQTLMDYLGTSSPFQFLRELFKHFLSL